MLMAPTLAPTFCPTSPPEHLCGKYMEIEIKEKNQPHTNLSLKPLLHSIVRARMSWLQRKKIS